MKALSARCIVAIFALLLGYNGNTASLPRSSAGSSDLDSFFTAETERVAVLTLAKVKSLEDCNRNRERYRREWFEMLSLSPLPERGDLKSVITGRVEHEQFTVEKLHYQSLPGFYVTANLYVPKGVTKPLPSIFYVCGHALVKTNGVSFGNKAGYQHHGAWFARNGYVCLTIDTVQLA